MIAAANEKIVAKIAEVARVLGWPDQVVSGMVDQIHSIAEMQTKMIDHHGELGRADKVVAQPVPWVKRDRQ